MLSYAYDLFIYDKINNFKKCEIYDRGLISTFYRLSCFFFTIWGLFVILINKTFKKYDSKFPWLAYGFLNFFHGFLIYINDVVYFGKKIYYLKILDRMVSLINLVLTWLVISFRAYLGYSRIHLPYINLHFILGIFTVYCKYRSTKELKENKNNCEKYMIWHGLWHTYPMMGCVYTFIMFNNLEWKLFYIN